MITIENFWVTVNGKGVRASIKVAKVPESVSKTTGLLVTTRGGKRIALMGERKVSHPEKGYRYHEFRYA